MRTHRHLPTVTCCCLHKVDSRFAVPCILSPCMSMLHCSSSSPSELWDTRAETSTFAFRSRIQAATPLSVRLSDLQMGAMQGHPTPISSKGRRYGRLHTHTHTHVRTHTHTHVHTHMRTHTRTHTHTHTCTDTHTRTHTHTHTRTDTHMLMCVYMYAVAVCMTFTRAAF